MPGQVLGAGTQKQRGARAAHARQVLAAYQGVSGRALPNTPLTHYADLAVQVRHKIGVRSKGSRVLEVCMCTGCPVVLRLISTSLLHIRLLISWLILGRPLQLRELWSPRLLRLRQCLVENYI